MILIRHAQSEFNVLFAKTRTDPGIRDPKITDLGRQQAEAASDQLVDQGLTEIVASPYYRTLETAEILARNLKLPIRVDPLIGEHAAYTSDLGSPVSTLRNRWPDIDFDHLPENWWPDFIEAEHHVDARSRLFRDRVRALERIDHILVVSHWGFIRALTGHEMQNCGMLRFDPHGNHPGGGVVVEPAQT